MSVDSIDRHTNPFNEFVIKVSSRCNLSCTYCYMYNLGDKSYSQQPHFIPDSFAKIIASRIVEHCLEHKQDSVTVILHGGEPLLLGKARISLWVNTIRNKLFAHDIKVRFATQTNGTLVDQEWVELFLHLRVSVGISLDGPREFHDRVRVDHQGYGSFDATMTGINTFLQNPKGNTIFGGVLSVVDPLIPPIQMWEFIQTSGVPSFDLRLPMATHDMTIPFTNTQLSDWLIYLFDKWFDSKDTVYIHMFNTLLLLYFDSDMIQDESLGTNSNDLVVIESDGGIEPSDNLKPCGEGFTKINYNILNNSFSEVLKNPLIRLSRKEAVALNDKCVNCVFLKICGGGHLTERFSLASGFQNPSVYCSAYLEFYHHVTNKIESSMPVNIQKFSWDKRDVK